MAKIQFSHSKEYIFSAENLIKGCQISKSRAPYSDAMIPQLKSQMTR